MQIYYKDHPEVGGYIYVALRAPNNTWNGFYDTYVYPLIANLTRQFRLYGDIDPNKVFIMGYSHGGYGAYAIGPKMPDNFATIHASASAATDGETTPRTLRNTIFTAMIGERDTAYGRYERNVTFASVLEANAGYINDEESYLTSVADAHRVAIAEAEISLNPIGGIAGGAAMASAPPVIPGAGPAAGPAGGSGSTGSNASPAAPAAASMAPGM